MLPVRGEDGSREPAIVPSRFLRIRSCPDNKEELLIRRLVRRPKWLYARRSGTACLYIRLTRWELRLLTMPD